MAYQAMDFNYLLGMPGFSDTLLRNHMTLYQGYLNQTNKIMETCARMGAERQGESFEHNEAHRRLGFEFDGMRLHEYYFRNLGGTGDSNQAPDLKRFIDAQFGGFSTWERDFRTVGMTRGVGWAILYQDTMTGQLINFWINEHQNGHAAGCNPILVMDVWEHAYMLDYGLKKVDYIDSFFRNINWPQAQARLNFELARAFAGEMRA